MSDLGVAVEFVNDPVVESLPMVGSEGVALLAPRTQAGRAFLWEPGGDAEALVALMGGGLRAIDGRVFQFAGDGSLQPVDTSVRQVVIVPPAGEPFLVDPGLVERGWCQVQVSVASAATDGAGPVEGAGTPGAEGSGNVPSAAPVKKAAAKKAAPKKAGA